MTGSAAVPGFRRHGLYYPFFHVRDERWIKVAALYWPKIVRIVPDQYRTRDSSTVRALADDFIVRQPPGQSVEAIAPRFAELITNHASELRARFHIMSPPRPERMHPGEWLPSMRSALGESLPPMEVFPEGLTATGVHVSEMTGSLQDMFRDAQLGLPGNSLSLYSPNRVMPQVPNSIDGRDIRTGWSTREHRVLGEWFLMHPELVGIYTSVLAEDFAAVNVLHPTTDQENAYAVTNNWTAERIADALLGDPGWSATPAPGELTETLGFLALDLVVPADLDRVPVAKIIDIRERHSAEFFAFGQAIDEAAAAIAELPVIRDQDILEDYLRQVVTVRFAQPLDDLRKMMRRLTGDAATMSINVKTQLPAGAALAGGAWLSGHPLLAGTSALAIGLMAVRRGIRENKDDMLKSMPAASYLLHTEAELQPKSLLDRTFRRLARITGTPIS
jgi:hypothetical protein